MLLIAAAADAAASAALSLLGDKASRIWRTIKFIYFQMNLRLLVNMLVKHMVLQMQAV